MGWYLVLGTVIVSNLNQRPSASSYSVNVAPMMRKKVSFLHILKL